MCKNIKTLWYKSSPQAVFASCIWVTAAAAATAKSLQSCLTLCDPIDSSPPGSPVPGILQARTLEWVAISFSNAWEWEVKVKSLSRVRLLATPWTAAYQAPSSMGFSSQECWSGVPLPSPELLLVGFKNVSFLTYGYKFQIIQLPIWNCHSSRSKWSHFLRFNIVCECTQDMGPRWLSTGQHVAIHFILLAHTKKKLSVLFGGSRRSTWKEPRYSKHMVNTNSSNREQKLWDKCQVPFGGQILLQNRCYCWPVRYGGRHSKAAFLTAATNRWPS